MRAVLTRVKSASVTIDGVKTAEIEKGSNSMKIGSKTVKTNEIVITLEDEALARFVEEVLTRFRDSKKVENYFNEYAESLSSMEGLAEVGDIEDLYDEMIDAIDELLDEIDELEEEVDGVEITITANIAKSGGELVCLEAEVRGNGGKVSMEAVCGPTWSNIEELSVSVDAGYDSLDFEYIVDVNDKKEFAAELSLDVSGYTMLEGEVNWDKKGGDFEIFANADGVTASLEAVVKKDGKALIIEPDSISADGQRISLDGIVITLKSSDKLPAIKKFDDILKMDADALEDLVLEAMDAAEELSGLLY